MDFVWKVLFSVLVFLPAIIFHEFAHAWAATRLGDNTARFAGRLSLNPLRHLDFFGTLAILFLGIGWAKPVPVDPRNFAHRKRDEALVAFAGPAANLLGALCCGLILTTLQSFPATLPASLLSAFFWNFLHVNVVLAIFNLLPIPPLDGASCVEFFIPRKMQKGWQEFSANGPLILFSIVGLQMFFGLSLLGKLIFLPAEKISALILLAFGVA